MIKFSLIKVNENLGIECIQYDINCSTIVFLKVQFEYIEMM